MTTTLRNRMIRAAFAAILLAGSGAWAAPGGGKGKPGGGGGGGTDACASIGFDLDSPADGSIDTSRTLGPNGAYLDEYQFVYAGEIDNPISLESSRWGVTIDTWYDGTGLFMAVGAGGPSRVDIYEVEQATPASSTRVASVPVQTNGNPLFVALENVGGDAGPDLVVTDMAAGVGWIYLSSGYPGGTIAFSQTADANLIPQLGSTITLPSGGSFGRKAMVYDEANQALYIGARGAETNGERTGAIFRCPLGSIAGTIDCQAQPLPIETDYAGLGNSMTLGNIDDDPALELLAAAHGAGKGKNVGPERIYVFDLDANGATVAGSLKDKGGNVNAFDYVVSATPGRDEVIATEFHSPGWVYVDAIAGDTFGGDDFELQLNPDLVHQYSNRTDAARLGDTDKTLLLLGGAGAPEGCGGSSNDGYAYLYVFQDGDLTPTVDTVQAPDGAGEDFGWDVAATGTDLIVIGERFATIDGLGSVGKLYFYRYVGAQPAP